jgi:hypothetical protein
MDDRTPETKQAARLNGNRKGGRVRSAAKIAAVRLNGLKGGRPRKVVPEPEAIPALTPQPTIAASVQAAFDQFYREHPEFAKYQVKR